MSRDFTAASGHFLTVADPIADGVPVTIACWFNSNDVTDVHSLVAIDTSSTSSHYMRIAIRGNGGDVLSAQVSGATTTRTANAAGTYVANKWHHAAGVFANNSHRVAYLDGKKGAAETTTETPSGLDSLNIGRLVYTAGPIQYMDGQIAHVAIWLDALTQGEIDKLASGYNPQRIRRSKLAFYAPLNGSNPEQDLIYGNDLTVSGATQGNTDPRVRKLNKKRIYIPFDSAVGTTAALTGTATSSINESDIVTGGKTVILTLTGDTFVTGTTSEDGIAGGSDSDKTGANKWDALIKTDLDNTDVVLSGGNTIATITLPAYATYDTDEQEIITWTIPAASLTTSAVDVVCTPTFTVDAVTTGIIQQSYHLRHNVGSNL